MSLPTDAAWLLREPNSLDATSLSVIGGVGALAAVPLRQDRRT